MGEMVDSLKIVPVSEFPCATELVMTWILEEWGPREGEGMEEFRSCINGETGNPEALVAVLDGVPVGTVAFRRHDLLEEERDALWINAIYVLPNYRGSGIGAELLTKAELVASQTELMLFAFTEIPEFYETKGWMRHTEDKKYRNWIVYTSLII
jgi:GNAT superfamily N-acetyltransferase